MMNQTMGGHNVSRKGIPTVGEWLSRKLPCFIFLSYFVTSNGFQQSIKCQRFTSTQRMSLAFSRGSRIRSATTIGQPQVSCFSDHKLIASRKRIQKSTSSSVFQEQAKMNNDQARDGRTSRARFWEQLPNLGLRRKHLLKRILFPVAFALLVTATSIVSPAWAETAASVIPSTVAPAPTPMIISCPISPDTEFRLVFRILYGALMGAALGKERAHSKHSAGVRTMSLVSMGAAVFTLVSCYGFSNFAKVDASRMAANVPSGVGFVGAGVITTSVRDQDQNHRNPQNNVVHGLTTAATIW
jgi:hypothetical protein